MSKVTTEQRPADLANLDFCQQQHMLGMQAVGAASQQHNFF